MPVPIPDNEIDEMETTVNWFTWAALSALFAGLTAILAKVGVKDVDANLATAIRTVVILIFAWSIALARTTQPLTSIAARTWGFLILSGLATGASWLCYFRAIQAGEVSKVAPVDKLSVVLVAVFAVVFLRERLNLREWLGIGLVSVGVLVLALKR